MDAWGMHFSVWSSDQNQHHLNICKKCKTSHPLTGWWNLHSHKILIHLDHIKIFLVTLGAGDIVHPLRRWTVLAKGLASYNCLSLQLQGVYMPLSVYIHTQLRKIQNISCHPGAFVSPLVDGVTTSWTKPCVLESSVILWGSGIWSLLSEWALDY